MATKEWQFIRPDFENEKIWKKVPQSEDGGFDVVGHSHLGGFHFHLEPFATSDLKFTVGTAQKYQKIDSQEGEICVAYTFFDKEEPTMLVWAKSSSEITGQALKNNSLWTVLSAEEYLIVQLFGPLDEKEESWTQYDVLCLCVYNFLTKRLMIPVMHFRSSSENS